MFDIQKIPDFSIKINRDESDFDSIDTKTYQFIDKRKKDVNEQLCKIIEKNSSGIVVVFNISTPTYYNKLKRDILRFKEIYDHCSGQNLYAYTVVSNKIFNIRDQKLIRSEKIKTLFRKNNQDVK